MIVRFDHITYVDERCKKIYLHKWEDNGWEVQFSEEKLKNIETKKKLMKYPEDDHDLYFMKKQGNINTELIFYERVNLPTQISVQGRKVFAGCRSLVEIEKVIIKLGGKGQRTGDTFIANLKGIFDKEDYLIMFEERPCTEPCLDDSGYGCVTLLVDSIEKISKKFDEEEFFCSSEELEVNSQFLNIAFVKPKCAELIFELISVRKRK